MSTFIEFMEYLNQEKDKPVQMGTIKSSKYQALAAGGSNSSKIKNKYKYSRKKDRPKFPDVGWNPCKDKGKKKKEKTKFTYYHIVWNLESACINNTIDMMV